MPIPKPTSSICWTAALAVVLFAGAVQAGPEPLRMNQIQVIATHNSYHVRPGEAVVEQVRRVYPDAVTFRYTHAPLDVQLERGVRSFELDLHCFPDGYQVYHVPHVDSGTTCKRLVDCLECVRDWSDDHSRHVPIVFLLEIKDDREALAMSSSLPVDAATLDRLDEEIRSVFAPDRLITPDLVRGEAPTLEAAVRAHGWPTLDAARGKVLFILHEGGANRDLYTQGRPSLEGRAMFVRSEPGRPDAATLVMDFPDVEKIQRVVEQGYLVRTRADAGLFFTEARRQDALASGAQIVSTDFPLGEAHAKTGYVVALPDGVAVRPNPVNAPARQAGMVLENPAYVQSGVTTGSE